MDKVQDGHAREEVRKLDHEVDLQEELFIDVYRFFVLCIQESQYWVDYVEKHGVYEVEEAD